MSRDRKERFMVVSKESDIVEAILTNKIESCIGPNRYQGPRWAPALQVLELITKAGILDRCVKIRDLRAIRGEGLDFFQKHNLGVVYAWGDVRNGRVSYLIERDEYVGEADNLVMRSARLNADFCPVEAFRRK